MITRRKLVIALGAGALAAPFGSFAQQQGKVWRIGFLGSTSAVGIAGNLNALREGLRELGYVEGRNLVIEFRWAEGNYDRLPKLAAELVHLRVDILVTHGTPGTLAAKQATTTIPIIMASGNDVVATGLVASLARPGGNITGSSFFLPELSAKGLELIKEVVPRVTKVAVLHMANNPGFGPILQAMEITARSLKMGLQGFAVRGPDEYESAFAAMAKQGFGAVAVNQEAAIGVEVNVRAIAGLAAMQRLPSIGSVLFANSGGLMGNGVNGLELYRRAAVFVDKILKGVKAGDLPVEQATRFEMVVNMKTAKALGIKIPNSILLRADKVIE
jgi:putative ABC transport system substrate-binding protein